MPQITIQNKKSYVSKETARTAVKKKGFDHLIYFMHQQDDKSWIPVFVGREALREGVHFHFNIVG
jgi:hypothetical protein